MTASHRPARPGRFTEIGDGVYVAVAEPESVNLGLVVGADACLLVDTGSSPAQGGLVRAAVAKVTDRPLAAVVVSHWHYDHSFGLAAFADVETLGHESVRPRLAGPLAAEQAVGSGLQPSELAAPSRELVVAAGLDLGRRRVEVAHLGRGHTEGDLVVVVPDADVLFAGDIIESAGAPWFGEDSFPHEWAATLDGLVGLMTTGTQAVPGHGRTVDREFVFDARGRVAAVSGEIRRLAEAGVAVDEALHRGSWPYPAEHITGGIAPGYAQLGPAPAAHPGRRLPLV